MSTDFIQCNRRINRRGILFMLMLLMFICSGLLTPALASISGVNGLIYQKGKGTLCPNGVMLIGTTSSASFKGGYCTLTPEISYVPHSGDYKVRLYVYNQGTSGSSNIYAESSAVFLDSTIPLAQQNKSATSSDQSLGPWAGYTVQYCYALVDSDGKVYSPSPSATCAGAPVPDPPKPDTSCTINNNNNLSVAFETIDRAEIATQPGSGTIAKKNIQIPITCTGGNVSVKMTLDYTPLTFSSTQVIKSSIDGLGVAVSYNSQPIKTTDSISIDLIKGSNTLNLDFQALRDPTVAVGGVRPGYFTASAVLVMTQQ